MPTKVTTSAQYAKLGDLSTYNVSTAAMPVDTADSGGAVPTINTTFVDGTDVDYLIDEDFSITSPTLGTYDGTIVSVSKGAGTNRYSADVHNIMSRLNTEHRLYPLSDLFTAESPWLPLNTLEYWTQQCGIFYAKVPGDVLFYQSQHGHYGAWAKGITRSLRSYIFRYSGAEDFTSLVTWNRPMNVIPRDSEAIVKFPGKDTLSDMGSYLPLMVPTVASGNVMVFGGVIGLNGSGRKITETFNLLDSSGKARALRISADETSGLVLSSSENGTTFTDRVVIPILNGQYQFYASIQRDVAGTNFQLKVLNSDGTQRGLGGTTVASAIRDSLSLISVSTKGLNQGSGSATVHGDTFISVMKAVPSTLLPYQKAGTPGTKGTDFMVGFSGNVWEHIKQFCSIYHLEMNYRNGKLTTEPRQRDLKVGAELSSLETRVSHREPARNVEVINKQHEPTGGFPYKTMWSADTVYQVGVGEVQEFTVQTDHSIEVVSNPVCVNGIDPLPYKEGAGQYVVTGSDGYIVAPAFWQDQGGKITCDITDKEGEIKIRIKGPDFDSSRAPYRISEGDAGRPALHITGVGVKSNPVTLKVPTGNSKAAKDVGVTIDSPFIGNRKHAYDAAARAAKTFATADREITFDEPITYDEVSKLSTVPAGALVKQDGNVLRVTEASQTHSLISGSASPHNTIYQVKRSFTAGGVLGKIKDAKTYYGGKPIGKTNLKPLKVLK